MSYFTKGDYQVLDEHIDSLKERITQLERINLAQAEIILELKDFVRKWANAKSHTYELAKEMTELATTLLENLQ